MAIRILHALSNTGRGGLETWLMNVLRNIDHSEFQMDFMVTTTEPNVYENEIRSLGGRVFQCLTPRKPRIFAQQFRRVLREHGPFEVVHSHLWTYSGYILRLAHDEGIPVRIAHSHLGTITRPPSIARHFYTQMMRRWIAKHSTHCLAISEVAAKGLFGTAWRDIENLTVLLYGFDFSRFVELPAAAQTKAELGIPLDRKVVGHIGTFNYQKNHEFLIRTFHELTKRRDDVHLLMVGIGPLEDEVRGQLESLGLADRCIFAGSRDDVPAMLSAMDAMVFPSRFEGLGIVVLEAQAAGVPVLTSPGIPEEAYVIPGMVQRLELEAGEETWSRAIEDRFSHGRRDSRETSALMAASRFGMQRCLDDLGELYRTALAHSAH